MLDIASIGGWTVLAIGYHLTSRLTYVVGVGVALSQQERHQSLTRQHGDEAGFVRFRRWAAIVMNNDAVSFVLLCLVTRQTVPPEFRSPMFLVTAVLLVLLGISVKLWAAARLGPGAYYWHNFFVAGDAVTPNPPGPYRYLKNPMYTVGYLHAYGLALAFGSWPGLAAAAFDQVAILLFQQWVEGPHYERLTRRQSRG
jgi:protein-S-isoprenylcysteine O-methyltransferase Ste14